MLKHFLLTSKKSAYQFSIVYLITRILYLASPLMTAYLIRCVEQKDFEAFVYACVAYFILFMTTQIMDYFTDITEENCYQDSYINLIQLIQHKIAHRDYRHTTLSLDQINQLLGQEFEKANKYFFVEIVRLVYYVISIVFILAVLFMNSWKITAIIAILIVVFIPLNLKASNQIDAKSADSLESMRELKDIVNDAYQTDKEDRFVTHPQIQPSIFDTSIQTFQKHFQAKNKAQSFYLNIISYGTLNFVLMVMIMLACFYVLQGDITFSTLYLFNSYTSQLWTPGEFVFGFKAKYEENKPIFHKIRALMHMKEVDDVVEGTIGTLSLDNYYGTGKQQEQLHEPLNITFQKNHLYLIKGDNGAGKTTLMENILHLANRYHGNILYNNQTHYINDFTYIPSKPYISKYHNKQVALGSDGQKKLYQLQKDVKDAKSVIIFDEPTNYLDKINKQAFIDLLNACRENHIVLVISHNPMFDDIAHELVYIHKKH